MRTIIIAFTQPGLQLAKKAAQNTEGTVEIYGHERCMDTVNSIDKAGGTDSAYRADSSERTDGVIHSFHAVGKVIKEQFYQCDRILFIGAAAIAVRVIAPYLKSKTTDPAVLVADEDGKFLISLLSGHWQNGLARHRSLRRQPIHAVCLRWIYLQENTGCAL